jgi:hypothetical protein
VLCRAGYLPAAVSEHLPVYRIHNHLDNRLAAAFSKLNAADQAMVVALAERLAGMLEPRIIGDEG